MAPPLPTLPPTLAPPPPAAPPAGQAPIQSCPRYVQRAQASLRLFLGIDDEDSRLATDLLRSSNSTSFAPTPGADQHLVCLSISSSKLRFDELLASALLQAFLAGAASQFNVRHLYDQTFVFSVAHHRHVNLLLKLRPFHRRLFSISFCKFLPAPQRPTSTPTLLACKSLSDLLLLHYAAATKFENAAWARLKSFVTVPSAPAPPACRMLVSFFQFPFPVTPSLCELILGCLFGSDPSHFHAAVETEDEFSFSVANRGVADLVVSFGDLRRPGIDLRFFIPTGQSAAPRTTATAASPADCALLHPRAPSRSPRSSVKVSPLRHGFKF
ncbi:uncharacterized protein [Aegilops tauschii subsp. strangulata]|uniref:uncharacterized protein n=1 Tax=Aegilops tauschii subsp. strangulata TaxID=200361 RepID=UPI001ABD22B7|nr:uncharacterized protein LOC120972801 [Aegilops tauschii subsp. strangulata]